MKISMPLFNFDLAVVDHYSFDDTGISISSFREDDILGNDLYSGQDIKIMKDLAHWALIYESENAEGYKTTISLLMLAFKIFCEKRYPWIKYRVCTENGSLCKRLNETMTYNFSHQRNAYPFEVGDLDDIKHGFLSLIEMDKVSIRTHNALYFLYSAWHTTHWMDSFILLMCSLESLFSKDKPGGATKTITSRVSSLLGSKERCTIKELRDLYDLRSHMTHGSIELREDPSENLTKLNHLDFVAVECFKEMVRNKKYLNYSDKESRDEYMGTLNTGI